MSATPNIEGHHAEPLLVTKLAPPPPRRGRVSRGRLRAALGRALDHPLTLVVAPAGSGKTTALAEWLAGLEAGAEAEPAAVAWLSLDASDDDPARFWRYLLAAVAQRAPGLAAGLDAAWDPGAAGHGAALPAALLNRLAAGGRLVLVLDDYHLIRSAAIHGAVALLAERAPPGLHLVIAARHPPPLPIERLRVRGALLEIGAELLRFSQAEAAPLLAESLGLSLDAPAVAALVERTEGWAAGLVLAALAARSRPDPAGYALSFSGASPLVLDYVTAEVLDSQPAELRQFLLATAPLDRLCAELCDALTGRADGAALLDRVDRAGLFLVPLDEERRWFRYHQLFADVLRARVARSDPQALRAARARAAAWFAAAGRGAEAVGYALAAEAWADAAALIADAGRGALLRGETATLRGWLAALPPAARDGHPALALLEGWLHILAGDIAAAWDRARAAEALDRRAEHRPEARALGAIVAMMSGRLVEGLALADLPEGALPQSPFVRGVLAIARGLHAEFNGAIAAAAAAYQEAARVSEAAASPLVGFLAWCQLGEAQIMQGRLRDAEASYRRAEGLARRDPAIARAIGDAALIGLGAVAFERGEPDRAEELLRLALGSSLVLGDMAAIEAHMYLAQVGAARGDFAGAAGHLDRAAELCDVTGFAPLRPMIGAVRSALDLRRGDLAAAAAWLDSDEVAGRERLPAGLRVLVDLGAARVLTALGRADEALATLDAVAKRAAAAGHGRAVIESLVLRSLALGLRGRAAAARAALDAAIGLAAPEGYRALLEEARAPLPAPGTPHRRTPPALPLGRYDLTEREREVLALVAEGLGNDAIARRLVVAPGTVKKHINRIFAKLEATSRTQAIVRARALGLLG